MDLKSINYSQLLADLGIQQTSSGNQIDFESAEFKKLSKVQNITTKYLALV